MFKYKTIAPAPAGDGKPRKYTPRAASCGPFSVDQTHSVQRRNARERNRVKQVNNSFARLRQHIPQSIIAYLTKGGGRGPHKKISKVDTLRIAVEYIRRLEDLVEDLNGCGDSKATDSIAYCAATPTATETTAAQLYYTNATSPLPVFQHIQPHAPQQQQQQFTSALMTPLSLNAYSPPQTQLDTSCHSPTSSFASHISFDSGTFDGSPARQMSPPHACASEHPHLNAHLQLKFEPYESFSLHEEDCTPDDEEILDYISLWQEQ